MSEKRSIFEEVSDKQAIRPATAAGVIDKAANRGARNAIRIWLMCLFGLVVLMIAIGGMTRLTDSGLSITEWRPVTGAIPPLSADDWTSEFDKYRAIPEYQLQNKGMSLEEFKVIYWWEWGHRQLGRFIGIVWFFGFFGFLLARKVPVGWTGPLLLPGALGGVQGAIGWWMVSSGLTGSMLDVASYRLATHLGLAFLILGVLAWYIFKLGRSEADLLQARRSRDGTLFSLGTGLMSLAFLQILLGALVAGIDAGRSFNDWPLMGGYWLPPEPLSLTPIWRNFFEDAGLVQFIHRCAGYLLFLFGLVVWLRARRSANAKTRGAFGGVMAAMILQMVLGIATVLYLAPWHLAILHQLGAVLLFTLILQARFLSQYPHAQSVRSTA